MSRTDTASYTNTVSAADVRQVMRLITADVEAVCRAAAHAARAFDLDAALTDVSILTLNGVIGAVHLILHKDGMIVRAYSFKFQDGPADFSGPPAGNPPLGYVPDGARVRLSVSPDPRVPESERRAWFDRLGWTTAEPLRYPTGIAHQAYGAFRSGGLYISRSLMANPDYDR